MGAMAMTDEKTATTAQGKPNKYKRILLKLSGEALTGSQSFGIERDVIDRMADEIGEAYSLGTQIAIVVGGGNFFRGVTGSAWGMDKSAADYIGMLATIMNCLILQGVLNKKGIPCRVQTAITMPSVAEPFIRLRAIRHLEKNRVVIFGGGTGNPHVTTDTAAALRGAEIKADAILMAKNHVDGVFDSDPKLNPAAKRLDYISFDDLISQNLKVMDSAAVSLCEQNDIPIVVFDFARSGAIKRLVQGERIGTLIASKKPE